MDAPSGTEKIAACAATGAFFGTSVGAVESVWSVPKLADKMPKFSVQIKHIGGRALLFGTVAGLYAMTEHTAESISKQKSPVNAAIGGAVAGLVPGILAKNARVAAATSIATAVAMAGASYWSGSSVSPFEKYAAAREAEQS